MKEKKAKIQGLALLSGGLDSILAVKILQERGIEVTGLTFVSYFFGSGPAQKAAKLLNIELKTVDFSDQHLEIVKKPCYGHGKAMNPCIDCHLLMLKQAGEKMRKEKFDFVATGEVLGERPMSQNKRALDLIEKESGLKGYLIRPLSAKLLEPTVLEKEGKIDREKLLDISGRSRKRQMALAKEYGIKDYPTPAGGCLLTDIQFGQRLKDMLKNWPDAKGSDVKLLRFGRHFWMDNNLIIVGRNKEDNDKIKELTQKGDVLIEPKEFPGPTILIRSKGKIMEENLIQAKELMIKYSPKAR
ncbi:MAG: tRNA 4-thiouridine(8) synthase ThiI [Candidatus Portnoybacteria bacterium]